MTVHLPTHLAPYTKGVSEIEETGATLADLLVRLDARYPGLRFRMIDEQDRIRPHIRFFVGENLAKSIAHPIRAGEEVWIVAALSGG